MELPLIPYSAETDHMFVLNLDGSLAPAYDVGEPCDCVLCELRAYHWAVEPDANELAQIEAAREYYVSGHLL